jgi:hypothetical protein
MVVVMGRLDFDSKSLVAATSDEVYRPSIFSHLYSILDKLSCLINSKDLPELQTCLSDDENCVGTGKTVSLLVEV